MASTDWTKDPDAVLDWKWDWDSWLGSGETITSSEFFVSSGLNIDSHDHSLSSATVWLSGGAPGRPYRVSNRITTNQGRTDERSIIIRVINR